jgi:hypothetical protein
MWSRSPPAAAPSRRSVGPWVGRDKMPTRRASPSISTTPLMPSNPGRPSSPPRSTCSAGPSAPRGSVRERDTRSAFLAVNLRLSMSGRHTCRASHTRRRRTPRPSAWAFVCGGGGNRTRVRQRGTRTSPGAVRYGLSQPRRSRGRVAEPGSVTVGVASSPVTGLSASGPLVDASDRAEGLPGLTDLHTRSGGEGEVGALCIGTYWFATMVDEITSPPRPASPGTTSDVETCHPRGWSLSAVASGPGALDRHRS